MSYTFDTTRVPRIKGLVFVAVAALSCGLFGAAPARADGDRVCLDATRVDHTRIIGKDKILFYMVGKGVWLNTLAYPCTINNADGFVRDSAIPEYCDNMETIKIIRTGETCMLGKFTPYEKQTKPS